MPCPHCEGPLKLPSSQLSQPHGEDVSIGPPSLNSSQPFAPIVRIPIEPCHDAPVIASRTDHSRNIAERLMMEFKGLPASDKAKLLDSTIPEKKEEEKKLFRLDRNGPLLKQEADSVTFFGDKDWARFAKARFLSLREYSMRNLLQAGGVVGLLTLGFLLMHRLDQTVQAATLAEYGTPSKSMNEPKIEEHPDIKTESVTGAFIKFLQAPSAELKSGFVRQSDRVLPLMKRYYAGEPLTPFWAVSGEDLKGHIHVDKRIIEELEVYELHLKPRPNITLMAPFVRQGERILLDWEALTGHGDLPLKTFFDRQSSSSTLLRVIASFEKQSDTPSHVRAMQLYSLDGPVGVAYLPDERLRFSEILDLEKDAHRMDAVTGESSQPKHALRLTIQARFTELLGFDKPVALIESIVRPNWLAP